MKFTIITVCFNSEKYIRKTIESVLNQGFSNVEYIIIDGDSTDNTISIAKEYEDKFKQKGYKYIFFSEPDKGIYDAMNKGIKKSTGDLIGFINSGDWYEINALETVDSYYNKEPFDMFYADINIILSNGKTKVKHSKYDVFPTSRHWNHPSSFILKSVYEELGLFMCSGIYDDFDLYLRVRKANKKYKIANITIANFSFGGISNKKSFRLFFRRIKDRYKCYRNNNYNRLYIFECIFIEIIKLFFS